MNKPQLHTFHIPVMGLGYTIDTPVKVARFGISSVVSIIEDGLVEQMRQFYYTSSKKEFTPILTDNVDYRALRITDYLNLMKSIVEQQTEELRKLPFEQGTEIMKYFELLPDDSPVKELFIKMILSENETEKSTLQETLRKKIVAGQIDVNIMSKLDKTNYTKTGEELPVEYCDAMSALRGFAKSDLSSSIIFSAGYNPRLYAYIEQFSDFFPDKEGCLRKKVTLKVSDFRSALIQGKILAKKGIWVSEFRIESGLNCGGHAFPTDGFLLGPILEEFKTKKTSLVNELKNLCNKVWLEKGISTSELELNMVISVQGGIGTADEDAFLREHYQLCSTGWGSPFLMVPEATNVDEETLNKLTRSTKADFYTSYASPLGIPFNNFRHSSSEAQRKKRIEKGRPGSPCYKKFLSSDTEFTANPICTASREYQNLKIKQLEEKQLSEKRFQMEYERIVEKDCLCEGLGVAAILKNKLPVSHRLTAVTICPGPNLAYFSKIVTLAEMVGHIYGRINILNTEHRPNIFVNELNLYVDYLKKQVADYSVDISMNQNKYLEKFKVNLLEGIEYYKNLVPLFMKGTERYIKNLKEELSRIEFSINALLIPVPPDSVV